MTIAMRAVLLVILFATQSAFCQTTFGTISGSVRDAAGAMIPNADVEAIHIGSNYVYRVKSNDAGLYTLPQLRDGVYRLRVTAAGFQEFVVQDVVLAARDERRIDISLQVGAVESKVEVTAGATLIETETARIGDSKTSTLIKSLPLNTRSLYAFLALSPGVVSAGGGQATRRFAGSRVNQSDQSIDGITVSNGYDGTQISPLVSYIESYEEVRVDMANNSADIGAVGQVTVVSKGGSNELHGNAFDYYATPWFRARNPFAAQRGAGVRHQPGATISGPVVIPRLYNGHNKTFFFFSLETSRGSNVLSLFNPTVPLPTWRNGLFADVTTAIRDPFNANAPFAGNQIPTSRINPASQKIQDRFWPAPNFGDVTRLATQNYREQKLRGFDPDYYYTYRIDHRFSDKSFVFGRYTWNRSYSRDYESNLPAIGQRWQTRDTRGFNASFTHSMTPSLVFESRWGMAFNDNPRHGPLMGKEVTSALGVVGLAENIPDVNGLLDVQFTGLGITRITQTQWRHPGFKNVFYQFQQHVNWYHGRHAVKGGYLLNRVGFQDSQASTALFGMLTFSNRYTGHPYGDFLLGTPTTAQRAFPQVLIDRVRTSHDFFVTDDFKINPKLTLNLGIRYEFHPVWDEAAGRNSVFDIGTGKIVVPDGALGKVSPLMPRGYVDVVEASSVGLPGARLLRTDKNNFAPRVGLAYRPFGNNTVLRAGFGMFYDVVPRADAAGGVPFVVNEPSFNNPTPTPVVVLPRVFPTSGTGGPASVTIPNAIRPDIRIPYSMQYNVTLEHQRWSNGFRLSYIGTNTRQGEYQYNINQPVPDGRAYIDKPRLFSRYPAINYITNGAGHQYNSLTATVERAYMKGFAYQFSWVWARDIGDLDRGVAPENAYDRLRERGPLLDTPTHRVSGNLIYSLPFGRGKKFLGSAGKAANLIVGGWELAGIYSHYSGQFLTPLWSGPDPTGTAFTSSRTPANVTIRPDRLADGNFSGGQRKPARWFDAAAFAAPRAGAFGTSAQGVIFGPGSVVVHAGLSKLINLSERVRFRLELTATNLANHPNYSNPASMNVSETATVGAITGVGGNADLDQSGARSFRAGFRLEW